jgi:pimeloyl-ACP methyl ester carboxylesterase
MNRLLKDKSAVVTGISRSATSILLTALLLVSFAPHTDAQTVSDSEALYTQDRTARAQPVDEAAFARLFSHRIATVNGIRIHYVTGGRGEPLILLHGWSQTWRAWRRVMPALAQHYTIIAPDLRGFGDSDKPLSGYDGRTVADDIHKLLQSLSIQRFNLVGHDLGGPTAYALAAAHPQQVRRFVILEGTPPGLEPLADPNTPVQESAPPLFHPFLHMVPDLPEVLTQGREKEYLGYFYRTYAYDPATFNDADIEEYARAYAKPGGMRGGFAHYRAIAETARQNKELAKRKLPMPVLAIGGEHSYGTAMERSARLFASDVRGVVVSRAGHFIPDERPVLFTQLLLNFFDAGENHVGKGAQ